MKPVEFLEAAMEELEAAVGYYERCTLGLGVEFRKDIEIGVKTIQESPLQWMSFGKRTRRYLLHRFPCLVIFHEHSDKIIIIAVAHGKRRPGYWHGRI
jgi:toxin ParE1/3/4